MAPPKQGARAADYWRARAAALSATLAARLTHARQGAPPDRVEALASLEALAHQAHQALEQCLIHENRTAPGVGAPLAQVRHALKHKEPIPGEPLQWHLSTALYDVCPTCGMPTIEPVGRRRRMCQSCGGGWTLRQGVGRWCEQRIARCNPPRSDQDEPLLCSVPGCDWDRERHTYCYFHAAQALRGRPITFNPKRRITCAAPGCTRSVSDSGRGRFCRRHLPLLSPEDLASA